MRIIKNFLGLALTITLVKGCFAIVGALNEQNGNPVISSRSSTKSPKDLPVPRSGYVRYDAGHGAFVDLPETWDVLSGERIQQIRDEADEALDGPSLADDPSRVTPLAANSNSNPEDNFAMVRVTFTQKDFGESDLRSATPADLSEVCDMLHGGMREAGTPRLIAAPVCSLATIGGKTALLARYQREGAVGSETWTVSVYQVPLATRLALVTISAMNDHSEADRVVADVLAGVQFY